MILAGATPVTVSVTGLLLCEATLVAVIERVRFAWTVLVALANVIESKAVLKTVAAALPFKVTVPVPAVTVRPLALPTARVSPD